MFRIKNPNWKVQMQSRLANRHIALSFVMPCLNEAETLAFCIVEAQAALTEAGIDGEVVIAKGTQKGDIVL